MTNSSKDLNIAYLSLRTSFGGYMATDIVGAATWVSASGLLHCALKCSTGEYIIPMAGIATTTSAPYTFNTGSSPRYLGNKIILPRSMRLKGVRLAIDNDGDSSISLMDASGNVLNGDDSSTAMTITGDANFRNQKYYLNGLNDFPCPKTLLASTAYYLVSNPTTTTNSTITAMTYYSQEIRDADLGIASDVTFESATSPTSISWSTSALTLYGLYPIFDQIDLGGGLITHPGMNGGING
jgi:hypothetical protein